MTILSKAPPFKVTDLSIRHDCHYKAGPPPLLLLLYIVYPPCNAEVGASTTDWKNKSREKAYAHHHHTHTPAPTAHRVHAHTHHTLTDVRGLSLDSTHGRLAKGTNEETV